MIVGVENPQKAQNNIYEKKTLIVDFKMTNSKLTVRDFKVGEHVIYVPNHADDNFTHPDCEHGVVTSINKIYVFVKFDPSKDYGIACDPSNLF